MDSIYHTDMPASPAPSSPLLRTHDVCDWSVTELMPGMVTLSNQHFGAPGVSVTLTPAMLPQLRQVIALLEGKHS